MTKKRVAAAIAAVNIALTPVAASAADDAGRLSVCYDAIMQMIVEWRVVKEIRNEGDRTVIVIRPDQFSELTPDNQAFVIDCKTMIEGIDANNPSSWPERQEDEPVFPEDWTAEEEV